MNVVEIPLALLVPFLVAACSLVVMLISWTLKQVVTLAQLVAVLEVKVADNSADIRELRRAS